MQIIKLKLFTSTLIILIAFGSILNQRRSEDYTHPVYFKPGLEVQ